MSPSPLRGFRIVVQETTTLIETIEAPDRDSALTIAEYLIREGCQGFLPNGTHRELIRVRMVKEEAAQ